MAAATPAAYTRSARSTQNPKPKFQSSTKRVNADGPSGSLHSEGAATRAPRVWVEGGLGILGGLRGFLGGFIIRRLELRRFTLNPKP